MLRLVADPPASDAHRQTIHDELLRHLDAAYNLARWLVRNEHDAQDIIQEAYLRAIRFSAQCRLESVRPWLLRIVRNTCSTWAARNRAQPATSSSSSIEVPDRIDASDSTSPEAAFQRSQDASAVHAAIELLPDEFREAIVLREIEGLAYKEIAQILGVPIGTVMSRLSRARERLKELLADYRAEVSDEL